MDGSTNKFNLTQLANGSVKVGACELHSHLTVSGSQCPVGEVDDMNTLCSLMFVCIFVLLDD